MKLVELKEVFKTEYGNSLALSDMNEGNIPFIARGSKNNGVSSYVAKLSDIKSFKEHAITVALSGSVLESFYQEVPFYTGYHIKVLVPLKELTKTEMLIYCSFITANKYRYNYGRQANKTLESIKIPHPDEIRKIANNFKAPTKPSKEPKNSSILNLADRKWDWFVYKDIFNIKKGKRVVKSETEEGKTPFVGAIDSNNGVSHYISRDPIFKGNSITINYDGNGVAESYYQKDPYWALDSVNVIYPKFHFNVFVAMFLTTLTKREKYRFSYGRKWHKARMEESRIKLPVDSEGDPDWQFMEDYIKSLPYSSNL